MFTIRTASLPEIMKAHALIPEFIEGGDVDFEERLAGRTAFPLIALDGEHIAGYAVSYVNDNAAYIWMVGTTPDYRRSGVYQQMFHRIEAWAREQGVDKLRLKTRNNKRNMLAWLVKNDFMFTEIESRDDIRENRIMTEKVL